MRADTWLEQLAAELRVLGLAPTTIASVVVEAQVHLDESALDPMAAFGDPVRYAVETAAALGAAPVASDPGGPVRLRATGLVKRYRRRVVLDHVDLTLHDGEIAVVIGPNGCGKSTLLRVVAGIEAADDGVVTTDAAVGYAPQRGGLAGHLLPIEHFELVGRGHGLDSATAVRQGVHLARELGWSCEGAPIVRDLSGGTGQKLNVVLAMLGEPAVLLLDEPYQGLDLDSTQRFWDLVSAWGAAGRSALIASHSVDALARATSVIELERVPS